MSLIIAIGSNIGETRDNLSNAISHLEKYFTLKSKSRVYTSEAVDYENQPDFLNQVLEFEKPQISPSECMSIALKIEQELGRLRGVPKGPRIIDIDILFYELCTSTDPHILLPHPRLFDRSFIVLPLMELPYFSILQKHFTFTTKFNNSAFPLD
ncbi:2-amino-4-hydroxy-6-hydroxymethyldihydropteridine diphosphokinase [Halobacteriovorax sp. HLS]|uniref:2-amino-4-hydroxy-6- hydroxymethyldihydropteridine diphosphokinase n=1 Tax=Halobacteriovorax sp. HLS TaxID=2234000 RepID=UPI000FDA5150|nr:2-amino-4-hydroxy-6-hydroxymethyldihydropteridine diphosphokinase [Halobacteriovorax sp. HLS]